MVIHALKATVRNQWARRLKCNPATGGWVASKKGKLYLHLPLLWLSANPEDQKHCGNKQGQCRNQETRPFGS